jgi:hypothetical protein
MTTPLVQLADDHPDDTGPYLCECCDATHEGPRDPAEAIGWRMSWDGWICPKCCKELEKPE